MVTDKVTRDDIRAIKIGQTGIFTLPNAKAVESGRVQFSTMSVWRIWTSSASRQVSH